MQEPIYSHLPQFHYLLNL